MKDNFEKHIKDTMNNPPELPFEEKLWKDMASRLDEDKNPARPLCCALVAFCTSRPLLNNSSIYFYSQYQQFNSDNTAVLAKKEQKILIDTIVQKKVTVIYDTIYNQM